MGGTARSARPDPAALAAASGGPTDMRRFPPRHAGEVRRVAPCLSGRADGRSTVPSAARSLPRSRLSLSNDPRTVALAGAGQRCLVAM
jgi:hypothetical protein